MSDTNIDIWLRLYQMREKLLVSPNEAHAVLNDPEVIMIFRRKKKKSNY
jgi:hypothetical protein